MNNKKISLLTYLMIYCLSGIAYSESCSFTLLANDDISLHGNLESPKKLVCKIESNNQEQDNILNFISIKNNSIVNDILVKEGTILVMPFIGATDRFSFELAPQAVLEIVNHNEQAVQFDCD